MNADDVTGLLLRDRMGAATAHLAAAPDTADRAVRGGHRRIRRRRTTVVAVLATIALFVALPFTPLGGLIHQDVAPARPSGSDNYGQLLGRPTQGDLATDERYLPMVRALWNQQAPKLAHGIGRDRRGEPTIVWAGVTPGGPAALVVQLAHLNPDATILPADTGQLRTLIGFVGVDADGHPSLVSYDYWRSGRVGPGVGAWYPDPQHKGLVIRDLGIPLAWNYYSNIEDAEELTFKDGVAVVTVPTGVRPSDVQITRWPERGDPDLEPSVAVPIVPAGTPTPLLNWPQAHLFQTGEVTNAKQKFLAPVAGLIPADGAVEVVASGRDGDVDVIIGVVSKNGRGHSYAVLRPRSGAAQVIDAGAVTDPDDTTVVVRLPGHGWAVVRHQAGFEWRAGNRGWRDASQFASLLPSTATDLRVTPYFGTGSRHVIALK